MKTASRLLLCVFSFAPMLLTVSLSANAQIRVDSFKRPANEEFALQLPQLTMSHQLPVELPQTEFINLAPILLPAFRPYQFSPTTILTPLIFTNETTALLYQAINKRIGIRYKFFGTDDRGYDCSGFVWRVFQDAGSSFDRVAARTLWGQLPEATVEETSQFGTLVFFNGLKHVGIVRDAFTFYHSSRSQGVTLSTFTGYWGSRITGYRRAPFQMTELANQISAKDGE